MNKKGPGSSANPALMVYAEIDPGSDLRSDPIRGKSKQ